jgi:hypothetical protein
MERDLKCSRAIREPRHLISIDGLSEASDPVTILREYLAGEGSCLLRGDRMPGTSP